MRLELCVTSEFWESRRCSELFEPRRVASLSCLSRSGWRSSDASERVTDSTKDGVSDARESRSDEASLQAWKFGTVRQSVMAGAYSSEASSRPKDAMSSSTGVPMSVAA